MEKTREYFRSMVSQRALKQTFFDGEKLYNASWDYAVSPDKRHFFSVCAEGPIIDAMLYEYIPGTGEMIKCTDTKTDIITYPRTIRPSKVHTCLNFMEDGRIIFNNHTTAASPLHPGWMPEAYFGHPYEGFPGSNVMIYDPATGKTEDLGIPVPYESIYGGSYDPKHRAYYFSGYFRGHEYRLDLDTRRVTDFGQYTEFGVYLHHTGPDGNTYLSTRTGALLRYNFEKQCPEQLGPVIPTDDTVPFSKVRNVMAYAANGPDGKIYMGVHHNENIYCYDIEKNELSLVGSPVPSWYRDQYVGLYLIFGMDFDSNGVLWYGLKILGNCMRLISWDIFGGGKPIDHGIIGTPEHASWNFCQAKITDDIFYGATTNHAYDGPAMIEIDLKKMMEDVDKPRERALDKIVYQGTPDADIYPGEEKLSGPAALDATQGKAVKTVHGGAAFADGILRARPRNNQFMLTTEEKYVTKLWLEIGTENSVVYEVCHDTDGNVVAISGSEEGGYYRSVLLKGELISSEKIDYTPKGEADAKAIAEKYKDAIITTTPGRAWTAQATCEAELADGSMLVGTKAGTLLIVKGDKCYNLGNITTAGEVRALAASPDRRTVYGVAGDEADLGLVFSYSMEAGLVSQGCIWFEGASGKHGLGISTQPCCIDYAPDGKSIAIGVRDRLGCVYEYYFDEI